MLVRRELAEHPDDLRLVLRGMTLLVRAVAARYRLSPADQRALEERLATMIETMAQTVREAADA